MAGSGRRDGWSRRVLALTVLCATCFVLLIGQLWYLQVLEGARFRDMSEKNRIRVRPVAAPRGILFDRNGLALVDNRPAFTLSLIPREMEDRDTVLARLAVMIDEDTRGKALGRLRRIEGQIQGIQRMIEEDKYCVDILLQLTAVQGAVEQVQKLLLGRHISSCVTDAIRSGNGRERQKKMDELLEVFSRFGGR